MIQQTSWSLLHSCGSNAAASPMSVCQVGAHPAERLDVSVDLVGLAPQEAEDVRARQGAAVSHPDDSTYPGECQSDGLCGPDERQPLQHVAGVVAVPGGAPGGRWQDADLLVVPDRLGRHAGGCGHLADLHPVEPGA